MPELKQLKSVRSNLTKIKTLHHALKDGFDDDAPAGADLPDEFPPAAEMLDLVPPEVEEMMRAVNTDDETLAERLLELKQRLPYASSLELLTHDWLTRHRYQFNYQVPFGGGNRQRGGSIADFVVQAPAGYVLLRIHGEYFHSQPGQREDDLMQEIVLQQEAYRSSSIAAVVTVWENRVLKDIDRVMTLALAGIELGR